MSAVILLTVMLFLMLFILAGVAACLAGVYERLSAMARTMVSLAQSYKKADADRIAYAEKQRIAEQFIDDGARAVETVHQSISGITFGILENIPVTRRPSRFIRNIHDKTAGGVYTAVRTVNKSIGSLAGGLLGRRRTPPEDHGTPPEADPSGRRKD